MKAHRSQLADPTKILTRQEIAHVQAELHRKAPRCKNTRLNLIIFRLACCCGLRASEIAMLQLADVRTKVPRPHIRIRTGASKGGRPRTVPLWWDAGTLDDIAKWRAERGRAGVQPTQPMGRYSKDGLIVHCRVTRCGSGFGRPAKVREWVLYGELLF
jgi:integrase